MERQSREDRPGKRHTRAVNHSRVVLILLILALALPAAQAREPDWNYSTSGQDIGSVATSSDGSLITVGAGQVLFFSRGGTLLGKEPYGTSVLVSADGMYTASAYFATLYFFKNPVPGGSRDQQKATKVWERELSEQVYSITMSRDGHLIVGQTTGRSIFIINTGTQDVRGNDSRIDQIVQVSPDGKRIIGISQSEVHTYSLTGLLTHTADLTTFSAPHTVLLPENGTFAVFNDGQTVRCVNSYNGTELWRQQVTGYVNTLSMTPGGSAVIAGTNDGNIERLDGEGNHVWSYAANQENRAGAGITCSAVSDNGETVAAGTDDGKVLFLDSKGELAGSYDAKEKIRHIAISGDGTTVLATGKNAVYAFFVSSTLTAATASPTMMLPELTEPPGTGKGTVPVTSGVPATTPVIPPTTQSPPSLITLTGSLLLAFCVLAKKRPGNR